MNKMASNIVDRWLITASEEDGDILSADFSEDGDVGVLGARIPNNSTTDKPKGKESNPLYGKGVNKKRYNWNPKKKNKCWGGGKYTTKGGKKKDGPREKAMKEHWKKWKNNEDNIKDKYDNFTAYFNKETASLRQEHLCYHKNPAKPGRHPDLEGMPEVKKTKDVKGGNKPAYNKKYWKARLKVTKKTANEEMVANIIDRYEP